MEFPESKVSTNFIDIFDQLINNKKINIQDGILNLFCMKIHNASFDVESLIDELSDSIVSYCLGQVDYDEFYTNHNVGKMNRKAKRLFRDYINNKGEIGEVILYSFLESHLKAPKILSKMKLKTSTSDYVKRSDGIHMIKIDDENYELVFGEAKMYESLNDGIIEAFDSIHDFSTRAKNNVYDEINLISANISSEFAEKNYELIKKIIKPTRDCNYEYDISFGVFVGFEVKTKAILRKNPSISEFRKLVKEKVKNDVLGKVDLIVAQIKKFNLSSHNFYIYFLPFMELDKTRTYITKELTQ